MAAPTEAEIRAAIAAEIEEASYPDPGIRSATEDLLYMDLGLRFAEFRYRMWNADELRASERERLVAIIEAAVDHWYKQHADALVSALADDLAAAGVAFAAEYPDAPRAERTVAA